MATMPLRLLVILLLLLGFRAADAASLGLTIVRGAGTVVINPGSARYEFKTRPISDPSPLTHLFLLRNGTKKPLTIEHVAVSCDCVQVLVAETPSLPVRVPAGQTVPVLVTVTMRRLLPGPVSKSAWIYLHGSGDSALRLEMHGTVRDDSLPASSGPPIKN